MKPQTQFAGASEVAPEGDTMTLMNFDRQITYQGGKSFTSVCVCVCVCVLVCV